MTKVFYRVIKPSTFADRDFETLEEASQYLIECGEVYDSLYYEYWQEHKKQCKIVKVTEITEELNKQD
jgi:hypothetical protein